MAQFGTTFDATTVDPLKPHEVLPPGKYEGQIVASEMRPTKDGNGSYLWLEIDILEGIYQGRKLFDRLNLVNANPQTVEIAQRTLSAICHAVGKMRVSNSEELHLIPMKLDVRVQPPKNGYGETNTIRYLPRDGAGTQPAPVQPQPSQAAAATRPAFAPSQTPASPTAHRPTAPWKRSA